MKTFFHKSVKAYWFDTGTPSFLIRQMQYFRTDITTMDDIEVPSSAFDRPYQTADRNVVKVGIHFDVETMTSHPSPLTSHP